MGSLNRPRLSPTQQKALFALIGLAFVIMTAGIGLMQAFYTSAGVILTPSPSNLLPSIVARQATILFPLGYLLLIMGLSIIVSVVLQLAYFFLQRAFYAKPWKVKKRDLRLIVPLVTITGGSLYYIWPHSSTYASLANDFNLHTNALWVLVLLSAWGTVFLRKALAILDKP